MKTYRIEFAKHGALIFVAHLDFSHNMVRALKRACLPVKYSEGFSPHPKIVFGLPLSVGMSGENEIFDITLDCDSLSCDDVKTRLTAALTKDFEIKKVYEPTIKLGKIREAEYVVEIPDFCGKASEMQEALKNPPTVMKKTKSGKEKELDIGSLISSYDVSEKDGSTYITMILASSGESYLNPESVMASLVKARLEIPEEYFITRTRIIFGE